MLSPAMRERLLARLAAADGDDALEKRPIRVVGPDLRAATIEDAERLVERIRSWLSIFQALSASSELAEDRHALDALHAVWSDLADDLASAIHATRVMGVPWEETRDPVVVTARRGESS